ncbi:MAG: ATP-binding protein, partial [Oscillospiraceae bacterium]|nr:ATP-binding protein [Oscillospiraceae bacterium]
DVIGFNVIDNGVGLDENNMRSFLQSDSTYKASIGGKGVGRFSWLKAFSKADIESIFLDADSTPVRRQFEFSLEKQEI